MKYQCTNSQSANLGSPKLGSSMKNYAGRLVNPIEFPDLIIDSAKALSYPLLLRNKSTNGVCYKCYECGVFLVHCENCNSFTKSRNFKSYSSIKCVVCDKK